jgi:hypothetical protein
MGAQISDEEVNVHRAQMYDAIRALCEALAKLGAIATTALEAQLRLDAERRAKGR